jgi:hypothetical protein
MKVFSAGGCGSCLWERAAVERRPMRRMQVIGTIRANVVRERVIVVLL